MTNQPIAILDALERVVHELMPLWTSPIIEAGWPRRLTPWPPWSGMNWEDWLSEFESAIDHGGYTGGAFFALLLREADPAAQLAAALGVRALGQEMEARAAKLLTFRHRQRGPREVMRWCAAVCLGVIGPQAKAVLPQLIDRLAREKAATVRVAVAWAIVQIGPRAAREAFVQAALFDRQCVVRYIAATAIGRDAAACCMDAPITQQAIWDSPC